MSLAIFFCIVYPTIFYTFRNLTSRLQNPDKHLDDLPAYLIEGQYQSSELGEQNMLEIGTLKDGINYFIQYLVRTSQYNPFIFQI
jgi:hypothetical protein